MVGITWLNIEADNIVKVLIFVAGAPEPRGQLPPVPFAHGGERGQRVPFATIGTPP